ncbi:MAG: tetratricopeptide repeat protein [Bacteroidales bacterium]|nr:tetratricopeptide repeat protein [Bacteroidales bacterium]
MTGKILHLFFILILSVQLFANSKADSGDFEKAEKKYQQAKQLRKSGNHSQARFLYEEAFELYTKLNSKQKISDVYNELGISYYTTGEYDKAMENFRLLLKSTGETGNIEDKYLAYLNMGVVYFDLAVYEKAMEFFNKALDIAEKTSNDKKAAALNQIANVFYVWNKHKEALEIYKEALQINTELNHKRGMADNLNNIGNIYHDFDSLNSAYAYYLKSFNIEKELDNNEGMAKSLNNLASILNKQNNPEQAQNLHKQALEINIKLNDFPNIAWTMNMIGKMFFANNQPDSAEYYFLKTEEILKNTGSKELKMDLFLSLSQLFESEGNNSKSYIYYKQYLDIKDSVYTEEASNQIELLKIQYQTQKKLLEIEAVDLENQKLVSEGEIQEQIQQRTSRIARLLLIILGLFLLFSVIIFIRYLRNRRLNNLLLITKNEIIQQKEEIEAQRDEISAQRNNILEQKEIVSIQKEYITRQKTNISESIAYAGKIQQTLLEGYEIPQEHFILFKPRDIVSGDFYWVYKKDFRTIIIAADCTGHGVPGASMSVLGITYLRDLVVKNNIFKPSEILNQLREKIINTLQQKTGTSKSKDGMDMAVVCINSKEKTLSYAGANNPAYIVVKDKNEFLKLNHNFLAKAHITDNSGNKCLFEIKPDKMPIGVYEDNSVLFTNVQIKLSLNEVIYLFSDGYADQFGGKTIEGKKFKYKPFKDLLIENSEKSFREQKEILEKTIENWMKGSGETPFQQVDDILVIGVKTE